MHLWNPRLSSITNATRTPGNRERPTTANWIILQRGFSPPKFTTGTAWQTIMYRKRTIPTGTSRLKVKRKAPRTDLRKQRILATLFPPRTEKEEAEISRIMAKQKILTMQSQMIISFIPFFSFLMMTTTAQALRTKVKKKRGIASPK